MADGMQLTDISFTELLPSSINQDSKVRAAAQALDDELLVAHSYIHKLFFWDRIDEMTEPMLTTLAWQLALAESPLWDAAKTDDEKRDMLRYAINFHRHKGTPWSLREILRILGFGDADFIEGTGALFYDGKGWHNGVYCYGAVTAWATYWVILYSRPSDESLRELIDVLARIAPARDWLLGFLIRIPGDSGVNDEVIPVSALRGV